MTGMGPEQVARRRAVEALRSGVPSWDAVSALGSGQSEAEDRFTALLDGAQGSRSGGLLLGAGFGAGKSHVLMHLSALALDRGFAVSSVVVSKETPLHDPAKVLRAAVDTLTGPGRIGGVLADAVAALDPDSAGYAELRRWVGSSAAGLDERFAATLFLHERLQGGDAPEAQDVLDAAVRFWAGEPLRVPDLHRALKGMGARVRPARRRARPWPARRHHRDARPPVPGGGNHAPRGEGRAARVHRLPTSTLEEGLVHQPAERLNKEIKRRTDVVGVFPNPAALLRLAGGRRPGRAHDEWQVSDLRHLSEGSLALLQTPPNKSE